jgi:hypothetical protein
MATAAPPSNRWLFGPARDLLLGCGVLYTLLVLGLGIGGGQVRSAVPLFVPALLTLLLSGPHYGATLLRVYERREDRRGYWIFSLWATLVIAAALVVGVYDALVASWLVTLYLTWSPWHYTGQNYGIGVMFLRRRGVAITPGAKRLLYASFLLSYALVFLVMHGQRGEAPDIPVPNHGAAIRFLPLGLPSALESVLMPAVAGAYLVCLIGWVALLLRRARLRDLAPTLLIAFTQIVWFSLPFASRYWGLSLGLEPLDWTLRTHYFVWIALGHAVQYLWVTTYYARSSPSWRGPARQYGKTLAAGAALWTLPFILFAPGRIGVLEYGVGLALVVSAAVNLHHFVLDGAIWKLRNLKIARVLIRSDTEAAEPEAPGSRLRKLVWSVCLASLAGSLFVYAESQFVMKPAIERKDEPAIIGSLDRLAWFGRDDSRQRLRMGRRLERQGRLLEAREQYERSFAIRRSTEGDADLARVQEKLARRGRAESGPR